MRDILGSGLTSITQVFIKVMYQVQASLGKFVRESHYKVLGHNRLNATVKFHHFELLIERWTITCEDYKYTQPANF